MSFDAQDCEEMPSLASEHIKELEAENKALKESKYYLLQALKYLYNGTAPYPAEPIFNIIEREEALKEKETK